MNQLYVTFLYNYQSYPTDFVAFASFARENGKSFRHCARKLGPPTLRALVLVKQISRNFPLFVKCKQSYTRTHTHLLERHYAYDRCLVPGNADFAERPIVTRAEWDDSACAY